MATCARCQEKLSWLDKKSTIAGGTVVCERCISVAGLEVGGTYTSLSLDDFKEYISGKHDYQEFISRRDVQKYCDGFLLIDPRNNEFGVGGTGNTQRKYCKFKTASLNSILDVQYYDDRQTIKVAAEKPQIGVMSEAMLLAHAPSVLRQIEQETPRFVDKTRIENCGFIVTYENGNMGRFNILDLIYDTIWITPQHEKYQMTRSMVAAMCEVLLPYTKKAKEVKEAAENQIQSRDENVVQQLLKAAELIDKGLLTKEEFEILKRKVLS